MENIFQKSFDNITSGDIQNLIDIQYKERQRMEYKKEMYGSSDAEKREMLRDISSMANAHGGYLVIGIEEDDNGIPVKAYDIDDAETKRNRIEQSCLSSIEPRISGLKCKTVTLDSGENVIIVLIPRSIKKPHMVTFSGLNQFWIRHNDKKFPMSVEEIRDACASVINVWKEIKQFLQEREQEIIEEILTGSLLVIGSSPILINEDIIDITDSAINDFLIEPPNQTKEQYNLNFKPYFMEEAFTEPTLYGLKISHANWITVELYRNGYYELKIPTDIFTFIRPGMFIPNGEDKVCINSKILSSFTVNYFRALASLYESIGFEQSNVAFMSFFNVEGMTLEYGTKIQGTNQAREEYSTWNKQTLKIPPKQIFSLDNPDKEAKYFLERLWNAFGSKEVPFFKGDDYSP